MNPNIFGTYSGLTGRGINLVSDDPILGQQLTDPVLTSIVLGSGVIDDAESARAYLFPEESAPSPLFKVRTTRGEELELRDTRRGATALIETLDLRAGERAIELVRRTVAALLDADALLVGAPYSLGSTAAGIAREVVLRDCENEAALRVADEAATFGTNIITIAGGQEWNAGGSMKATIEEAAQLLFNLGIPKEKLKLALFGTARAAAENDPTFLERRQYGPVGAQAASLEDVRGYLGIGEVRAFNKIARTSVDSPVTRMFGDVAVLFYPGDTRLSTLLGGTAFGRTFVWGRGSALVPYYIPERTSWAYPFQRWQKVEVLNNAAAVLIKNPYAEPA